MPHDRFFVDAPLTQGEEVALPENEVRHLNVMRSQIGQSIELVNGRLQLANAEILNIDKRKAMLKIRSLKEQDPSRPLILCQAIPRLNRLEMIVEKGTELGMTELWLFAAAKTEKKTLSPNQLERLRNISIAAIKQCGRLDLPQITIKPPLSNWEPLPYPAYFGDTHPEAPKLPTHSHKEGCMVFIGPESGFSPEEEGILRKIGARGIRLHPNILRTETAAIVALTVLYS